MVEKDFYAFKTMVIDYLEEYLRGIDQSDVVDSKGSSPSDMVQLRKILPDDMQYILTLYSTAYKDPRMPPWNIRSIIHCQEVAFRDTGSPRPISRKDPVNEVFEMDHAFAIHSNVWHGAGHPASIRVRHLRAGSGMVAVGAGGLAGLGISFRLWVYDNTLGGRVGWHSAHPVKMETYRTHLSRSRMPPTGTLGRSRSTGYLCRHSSGRIVGHAHYF